MTAATHPSSDSRRARLMALALDPGLGWASARRLASAAEPSAGSHDAVHPAGRGARDQGAALLALARCGGRALVLGDPDFPAALVDLAGGPLGLFARGIIPPGPMLAIVGARACTRAAARLAYELGAAAVAHRVTVVSGGAIGIDAAAHEGALGAGGQTVAVLGSALDRPYPARNLALFDRIARAGAVVTPFPPGVGPLRPNFPRRNGVVAALASHVLVVEARARSGALLTARAALGLGRAVGAVPGSAGCDRLLSQGARPVTSPDELAGFLRGTPATPVRTAAPTPEAERALAACDAAPRRAAEIAARAGLDEEDGLVALGFLELWGLVARAAGDRFVRVYPDDAARASARPAGEEAAHSHVESSV